MDATTLAFEIGLVGTIVLITLVFLGVRVYIAAAIVGVVGLFFMKYLDYAGAEGFFEFSIENFEAAILPGIGLAGTLPHSKSVQVALSVLPMFILIGFIAYHAGLTHALFNAARAWFGWVPGGLAVASVFATAGFAAVSGASTATAAVFSRVAIPRMLEANYDPKLAAGVVAAGGTLASLIPPSAILVIYAIIVEESVGALILAGFLPGVVSAIIYAMLIIGQCMIYPHLGRAMPSPPMYERIRSIPPTFPVLFVVAVIFYSMYSGAATPTEAGALGAFIVLVLALARGMKWPALQDALLETARLTVMIFALIWSILTFVIFLGFTQLPEAFAEWIVNLDMHPILIMAMILIAYAILGMFMDAIGMLLLTLPVVYPAVILLGPEMGIHPAEVGTWFGILVVKMCEVCLITPPIGLNCYVVHAVRRDIALGDVFKGIAPFFVADAVTIALFVAVPDIILWLPRWAAASGGG